MQAGSAVYQRGSALRTLATLVRTEGVLSLYRGLLPPLLGSSVFRSVQFSAYGAVHAELRNSPAAVACVPGMGGLQYRVLAAGVVASTARALVETPLEYIKVRRQTGQSWRMASSVAGALASPLVELRSVYRGFGVSWARTVGLMTFFFVQVDYLERHHAELVATPLLGPFIKGGICATTAWVLVWPLEVLKNRRQAGTVVLDGGAAEGAGTLGRLRALLQAQGFRGLFRGIGPGLTRSLVANGASMIVYSECSRLMRGEEQK
jgi:solute carrier family 25 carnitine/acylcarnitine transporter 20/29